MKALNAPSTSTELWCLIRRSDVIQKINCRSHKLARLGAMLILNCYCCFITSNLFYIWYKLELWLKWDKGAGNKPFLLPVRHFLYDFYSETKIECYISWLFIVFLNCQIIAWARNNQRLWRMIPTAICSNLKQLVVENCRIRLMGWPVPFKGWIRLN